jgi:hypothetical protein
MRASNQIAKTLLELLLVGLILVEPILVEPVSVDNAQIAPNLATKLSL